MSDASLRAVLWRWLAAAGAGAAAGALGGAVEGAGAASTGVRASAALLDAGLVAASGPPIGLACATLLALTLGGDPAAAWRRWRERLAADADAAARFIAGAVALQIALLVWIAAAYHAARIALGAFHHMGLAALLLLGGLAALGALLWLLAAFAARRAAPLLTHLPARARVPVAAVALLLTPLVLALLIAGGPPDGAGVLGFLGLLKREELELAFLWPALLAAVAAGGAYGAASGRRLRWLLPLVALLTGAGAACAARAATDFDRVPAAALAVERSAGLGSRLVAVARRLSDRDGDGAAALFGGGDCDDRDPARWPGAIDVPANGVDEDCSGADAVPVAPADPPAPAAADAVELPTELSLLLLTVDALRWDTGYMGYARPITPAIDALAERGVVLERSYALSSFTGRSLAPIFIGRYPSEAYCNAVHFTRYHERNELLAETLAAAGFATAGVGSHPYFAHAGLEQGFARWFVEVPPGSAPTDQKVTSPLVADRAIELLADRSLTGGRFFLWAHFMDPHRDYLEHPGFDFGKTQRDRYDGEVAFTDHHLGRVVQALVDQGLGERTIIMVTADHGEAFREHDIAYHGRRLWEEVVRVPWVWVVPGLAPRRVAARVSQVDLAATVYELLGVEPPAQAGGQSLVPLMTGATPEADRRIFLDQPLGQYMPEMYAVIDSGSKLIHTVSGNRFQLFDLDADPGEQRDLAPTQPERLAQLKQLYQQLRAGLEPNAERYRP